MEHYVDLLRLCQLMHEKNEIQRKRHYARKRALRFQEALTYRAQLWRRKEQARFDAKHSQDREVAKLHKPSSLSNKLLKMSHAQLKILWYKARIADNQAKLDIALFTEANRKEMREILRRNEWWPEKDNTNGHYIGVRRECYSLTYIDSFVIGDGTIKGRERIKELAMQAHATQDLENALVSA